MSNVKALPGSTVPTNEPNQSLIKTLEDILESARSGELQSFIATGFRADGLRMSCVFAHRNVYEFIGSIELLKRDYIEQMTERL